MTKHNWKLDEYVNDGSVDTFAYEAGYHNGPMCVDCGFFFCHHCDPDGYDTECGEAPRRGDPAKIDASVDVIRSQFGLPPMAGES